LAINQTIVKINVKYFFVWVIIDVETKEILETQVTVGRISFDCLLILKIALRYCKNKPRIIYDGRAWYKRAIERVGCVWHRQKAGLRNHIERCFGRLKFKIQNFFVNFIDKSLDKSYQNLKRFL
jgi:transposase-like protein